MRHLLALHERGFLIQTDPPNSHVRGHSLGPMIPDERPLSQYSVAVLIPIHNGESFIRRALEAVTIKHTRRFV